MDNFSWNVLRFGEYGRVRRNITEKTSCRRKFESKKSVWDSEKNGVCSMCQESWPRSGRTLEMGSDFTCQKLSVIIVKVLTFEKILFGDD